MSDIERPEGLRSGTPTAVRSGAEPALGLLRGHRRIVWLALLALVYVVTFFVGEQLAFEPLKDEKHFWASAQQFSGPFPPSREALLEVEEVVTPLSIVLWGQLERFTGAGIFLPRLLNLLLSAVPHDGCQIHGQNRDTAIGERAAAMARERKPEDCYQFVR